MDFVKIPGGTTQAQQIAAMNNNFSQLERESTTKIYNDSNGVPHIAIGIQRDGSSRIRIAKAGVDVTTANDSQLVFNSDQNSLKVVKTSTFTISAPANSTQTFTVPHGLSFVPILLGYVKTGISYDPIPVTYGRVRDDANQQIKLGVLIEGYTDINNIVVTFVNSLNLATPATGTYTFRYYLLQETAS